MYYDVVLRQIVESHYFTFALTRKELSYICVTAINYKILFQWTPPRHSTRGFSPGAKNNNANNYNGFQSTRSNYVNSPDSFTTSTHGKSNLHSDFNRYMKKKRFCINIVFYTNISLSFSLICCSISDSGKFMCK